MKTKLVVLTLCAALLLGGCTFLGVVQTIEQMLCSWSVGEQTEAAAAEAYLESALGLQLPDNVSAEVTKAIIFADIIRQGVCLGLSQLKAMLATVDQVKVIYQGQEALTFKMPVKRAAYPAMTELKKRVQ